MFISCICSYTIDSWGGLRGRSFLSLVLGFLIISYLMGLDNSF